MRQLKEERKARLTGKQPETDRYSKDQDITKRERQVGSNNGIETDKNTKVIARQRQRQTLRQRNN